MAVDIYEAFTKLQATADQILGAVNATPDKPLVFAPVTYFFPGAKWDAVLAHRPAITLINPSNGPGASASATYQAQVVKAKAAGAKVFGYVHTKYGARLSSEVRADIDNHFNWYGVDGIFIDTVANKVDFVAYYAELAAHIKSRKGTVVLNPGTSTIEAHAAIADHIMVFENTLVNYKARSAPAWEAKYPRQLFWHAVHTCPQAELAGVVALAKQRNCGLLYVTDDIMPNPYDTNPTYLAEEAAAIAV